MLVLFAIGVALYFVPTIVALARHTTNATAAVLVNIFLGWSVIGWIIALILATTGYPRLRYPQPPYPGWGPPGSGPAPGPWGSPGRAPGPHPPPPGWGPPAPPQRPEARPPTWQGPPLEG